MAVLFIRQNYSYYSKYCHYSPINLMLNYSTKRYNVPVKLNRTFKMLLAQLLYLIMYLKNKTVKLLEISYRINLFTVEFQSCFL